MALLTYRTITGDTYEAGCLQCHYVRRFDDEHEADAWMRKHERAYHPDRFPRRTQP